MKKLLKSEVCGSINSAQIHCSWKTWSKVAATVHKKCMNSSHFVVPNKKKGLKRERETQLQWIQTDTKS